MQTRRGLHPDWSSWLGNSHAEIEGVCREAVAACEHNVDPLRRSRRCVEVARENSDLELGRFNPSRCPHGEGVDRGSIILER